MLYAEHTHSPLSTTTPTQASSAPQLAAESGASCSEAARSSCHHCLMVEVEGGKRPSRAAAARFHTSANVAFADEGSVALRPAALAEEGSRSRWL